MALFKILRGKSVNLSKQAKTDGWAWFTSDTGSFYIDAQNDFATVERIKINPKSFFIEIDLYSDNGIVLDAATIYPFEFAIMGVIFAISVLPTIILLLIIVIII